MSKTIPARPLAVLVSIQVPGVSDVEHAADLAELGRLVSTLGYETVATVSQRRAGTGSGTVLGSGKLKELAKLTGGPGVVASGAADRTSKAREKWEAEAEEAEGSGDEEDRQGRAGASAAGGTGKRGVADEGSAAGRVGSGGEGGRAGRGIAAKGAATGESVDEEDGATDGGATDDGATDDGATDDGATDDGATDDGATDDGATDDGATDDGATDDGATDDGATDDEDRDEEETDEDGPALAGPKPTVVVVAHELSPSQLRNLEKATAVQVLDRTGVIVDIFHRHARSREARMQVEIARLKYLAPRLRESAGRTERQAGRGAGDSAVELDRRKIRDRLAELKEGLAAVQQEQDHRRYARRDQLRVALVGYTNAGKSSLMRALTGSEVLVADQLFATLDTTVRALQPETRPRILVSDTVGFIQKLPHDLVASFRSTLDEALEASLLLYVVDASDPTCDAQLKVTQEVLNEIGAQDVPSLLLLNKADRLDAAGRAAVLARHPKAIMLSAHQPGDVTALRQSVIDFFEASMVEADLVIPYARQGSLGEVYETARVVSETFDESGRKMRVRSLPAAIAKLVTAFGS